MRIFTKLFISIFCFVIVTVSVLSLILAQYQISYAENSIIEKNAIMADSLSRQIEAGYFRTEWPHEGLSELSKRSDFIFWWVVKEDGTIYRADNVSFMGTRALDYFPQVSGLPSDQHAYIDEGKRYGIYFRDMRMGTEMWRFWLGSSLAEVGQIRDTILLTVSAILLLAVLILSAFLFAAVRSFTTPVSRILKGTTEVSKGNFDYKIEIRTKDEFGKLASQFNVMTEALRQQRKKVHEYSKDLEKKVNERTAELEKSKKALEGTNVELERFNKLAIGRELKMVELKKRIADFEAKSGKGKKKK